MPGGGVALVNAISTLDGLELEYPDENTGIAILRCASEAPLKKIAANAGEDGGRSSRAEEAEKQQDRFQRDDQHLRRYN